MNPGRLWGDPKSGGCDCCCAFRWASGDGSKPPDAAPPPATHRLL